MRFFIKMFQSFLKNVFNGILFGHLKNEELVHVKACIDFDNIMPREGLPWQPSG